LFVVHIDEHSPSISIKWFSMFFRWANLRNAADVKKAKLDKGLRLQHFHADIHETKVNDMHHCNHLSN